MQLVFDCVSYSYSTSGKKSDKAEGHTKKRFWNRKRAAESATKNETPAGKPAWGNDPSNEYALKDVSFTLDEGEFLGICGHTGSGKSTLIQHMNGLLKPTSGRVLLDGADLADKKTQKACRGTVGVVFQYPEHQLFAQTVYDDVAFGPRNLGLSEDEVDSRVREALQNVDLDFDALSTKSPFELSGGQQRRVAFAGVLAMRPHILVLDEPAAGLDPKARASFLALIEKLHQQGLTVVMVSHSMEDLARLTDQLLVLNQGHVFAQGSPTQVFADDEGLRSIGLDVPAAQRTANALRKKGIALTRPLYTNAQDLAADIAAEAARRGIVASAGSAEAASAADPSSVSSATPEERHVAQGASKPSDNDMRAARAKEHHVAQSGSNPVDETSPNTSPDSGQAQEKQSGGIR